MYIFILFISVSVLFEGVFSLWVSLINFFILLRWAEAITWENFIQVNQNLSSTKGGSCLAGMKFLDNVGQTLKKENIICNNNLFLLSPTRVIMAPLKNNIHQKDLKALDYLYTQ